MKSAFILVFGLFLGLASCAHDEKAAAPAAAERGRLIAFDLCSGCHAVGLTGASDNAAAPPFRDSLARYADDRLARDLQTGVLMGHPALPTVRLSRSGARDFMAYLKYLQATAPR